MEMWHLALLVMQAITIVLLALEELDNRKRKTTDSTNPKDGGRKQNEK